MDAKIYGWVYIQSESQLWTVGFYDPRGLWHSDSDHDTKDAAADRTAYLNGSEWNRIANHIIERS